MQGVAQVLAHVHIIIGVAIVQHPPGNGGRRMLAVSEHPDLRHPFYEGAVEHRPRTAGKRDDAHVVIGH